VNTTTALRAASATHVGLQRDINEDRVFADLANGIFVVVDGMGGHAAGATAAETALKAIHNSLRTSQDDSSQAIRDAIIDANNRIFSAARENPAWHGMSCVLTVAVVQEDCVTWGHVGDSRLYLFEHGILRKLTADHSPVGEQVDLGLLNEYEGMRHPRRHEVFRDVGSQWRPLDDPDFVQIESCAFLSDGALLLCTDGVSDALTSAEITAIVGRFKGDPEKTANNLVATAIERSGEDNVSVIFVAGPDFAGFNEVPSSPVISRYAITRVRKHHPKPLMAVRNLAWLLIGVILGALLVLGWGRRADLIGEFSKTLTSHHFSSDRK
jgi:serine/threonine protein phosphatase PrpC